jgi:hypothetical protein
MGELDIRINQSNLLQEKLEILAGDLEWERGLVLEAGEREKEAREREERERESRVRESGEKERESVEREREAGEREEKRVRELERELERVSEESFARERELKGQLDAMRSGLHLCKEDLECVRLAAESG